MEARKGPVLEKTSPGGPYPDFWQIFGKMVFDDDSPYEGGIVNRRVFIDDFEWWAWLDLNHRPRPYQRSVVRFYNNLQDRGDCQTTRESYKT